MKLSLYGVLCTSLLLAGSGCNSRQDAVETAQEVNEAKNDSATASAGTSKMEEKKDYDSEFMTKAASGGMMEVELGKAVAAKATTPEAKQFANMMVTDHTKANTELKALAAKKNITLPAAMGEDQQDVYKDVTEKTGINMDKEYLREMVQDHEKDVKEFIEASEKAMDPDIKAFAKKTTPVLQHHLEQAQKMLAAVKERK
ncbi:DUF4142 domain-containing protein [Hymenobacter sp. DG25A]|uniref:DUF4142 domain-containing protein n=1 Tax=Hymenobacter sp. DG25A TaxID=1385663 RepID=UPI0006BCC2A5|nr:DUF4142 domain-containing protein [Hymenobacter sp. DG25A]ALD22020.1 hypothetical protein AM218_13380 [Hymenobacter sp. DG25A]